MHIQTVLRRGARSALRCLPERVRRAGAGAVVRSVRQRYGRLPLPQAFEKIYAAGAWGPGGFNSGSGSAADAAEPFVELLRAFIAKHGVKSMVDLGCGDFRVGRRLLDTGVDYTGIDIVPALVARNQREFGAPGARFECRNLVDTPPPGADVGLLRQVLQHLSNDEIARLLRNCAGRFRWLIVAEHVPNGPGVRFNLDKPHGPDVRCYNGSGVFLEHPPFNLPVELLAELPLPRLSTANSAEVLRTVLVKI